MCYFNRVIWSPRSLLLLLEGVSVIPSRVHLISILGKKSKPVGWMLFPVTFIYYSSKCFIHLNLILFHLSSPMGSSTSWTDISPYWMDPFCNMDSKTAQNYWCSKREFTWKNAIYLFAKILKLVRLCHPTIKKGQNQLKKNITFTNAQFIFMSALLIQVKHNISFRTLAAFEN